MSQSYWVDRVYIKNRSNCCPERLEGTKVFVDGKLAGQITGKLKMGLWVEVKFSKPMFGKTIRLVTTQNNYLSISGFEAWTAGPNGEPVKVDRPSGPTSKISLENAKMNKPYDRRSYKAEWALEGGKRTAITTRGVYTWWQASFVGGPRLVDSVRIMNRKDCCGDRIVGTRVTIGG
jgi:hypothetical protein